MRRIFLAVWLFAFAAACTAQVPAAPKSAQGEANALASAANARLQARVRYDPAYVRLDYPGGDVPAATGVCTDVIIRSYRAAYGFDFQKAVHEDMRDNFDAYPSTRIWGLSRPDKNIDHRRVPNLETYLTRGGYALPITQKPGDYLPGDVVSWRLTGTGLPHIGIISPRKNARGTPLVIHNIGAGVNEDDMLFDFKITGHFRFHPDPAASPSRPAEN